MAKKSAARCSICGSVIRGRVSRSYGGYVCHKCLSMGLKLSVRLGA
ncbi:hypothetical protein [Caldivirga maquilingensis]|nr:hypothetical protein [Caldivirga maquilingensis]